MTSKTDATENDLKRIQGRYSPAAIMGITILGIALAEVIAMIVVYFFQQLPYFSQIVIDAGVMILIIFPLLYYLSFKPIIRHIEMRHQAEKELRQAYDELERRVQDRTEELRIANSELEEEINVRRQAEDALQASEQRLERAQEIAHLGSWELDLVTNHLTWSDEVYRIFGLKPQQFDATYEAFLEAVHPDDRAAVNEAYSGSIRDGRDSYEIEHRLVRRSNGEIRIVHEKCEHFRNESGEIIRSIGMVHDITERKRAEEQLQYQATLLANVNDAIIASDAQFRLTAWNSGAKALYGWKAEDVLGRNGIEIIRTEWPEEDADAMRQVIAKTGRWRGEATQVRSDGTRFPVEVSSMVLFDDRGQTKGFVSVNRDITERKKADEILQRFQLLSEHSRDIILFMRYDDGQILEANTAATQAYGYTRNELLGLTVSDLREVDTGGLTAEQMGQANAGGTLFETVHRRKDGSHFPVEVSSQGATIGGVRTLVSIIRDITERKEAEAELERTNQKLNEILTSIQDDFYVLDRDWNFVYANPLFTAKVGKKPEDFVGNNIWTMFPKHIGTIFQENFISAMEKREVRRFEIGGKYTNAWYRMTVFPSAEGITVLGTDITERKKVEDALLRSEENFTKAFMLSPTALMITHLDDGHYVELNDAYCTLVGYDQAELRDHKTTDFNIFIQPSDRKAIVDQLLATGSIHDFETSIRHRSGAIRQVVASQELITFTGETCILTTLQDITEIKRAEEILRKLNRTLRALSNTNQAMIRSMSEKQCLEDACKIVVEDCGHSMVWIGYAQDDEEKSVIPVAYAGFEDGYLESLKISWADSERGQGPTGTAIRTGKPSRCTNMLTDPSFAPWRAQAVKHGYASSLVLPLIAEGRAFGAINIYSREPDFFSKEEEALLTELAGDLAYGIQAIRLRDAHAQTEAQLRIAHDELELRVHERTAALAVANRELSNEIGERKEVERQLRIQTTAMEAAADGIVITDPDGIILWVNPALFAMSGYTEEELVGQYTSIFNSGEQDQDYYRQMWAAILAGQEWQGELINRRKDGTHYIEQQTIAPVIGEAGKITHFISIKRDITEQKQAKVELERRNLELQVLSETEHKQRKLAETLRASAQALSQSLDLDTVVHTLLKHLRALVRADTASAIFPEGETHLGIRAVEGFEDWTDPDKFLAIKIDSDRNPFFGRLMKTRETILIPNTDIEPEWVVYSGMEPIHNEMYVPVVVEGRPIGIVGLGKFEANYFMQEHVQWAETLTGQAAVAIQNAWLFDQVRAGRQRMQFLSRRLVEIQESERRYIARELHDHAGQNLTSLMLGLGTVEREAERADFVRSRAAELKVMTDHILEDLHRLAINLRPASLDHLGLYPALEQLIKAFTRDTHLPIKLKIVGFGEDDRFPQEVETTLYRVVQEAITNAVRHAHGSRIDVVLEQRDDSMLVIVEDDGRGFDVVSARENGRLGLLGMKERIEMLGGTLTIESTLGSGTTLFAEVPCAHSDTTR